jgi:quinolinate synthase
MNELIKAINELKKEKNAIILGHYYQKGEIQDIADYVGDSLALAQWAAKTEADIIVMCGVHFMGETAKVLCPDKKVLVPDMAAGCSLADRLVCGQSSVISQKMWIIFCSPAWPL